MKNHHYARLGRRMREYHRTHPWRLRENGLFIPHSYDNTGPNDLTYWDDVGFILNGRRFIVWWQHPRYIYSEAVVAQARIEAGDGPREGPFFEGATKNYKHVGKSGRRKKLMSYTLCEPSVASRQHYETQRNIEKKLINLRGKPCP